ncbi:hypothetical protein [Aquabacterium sp.]|uniref:hypothetical protein n=1 Tax=Aquabacterium sp. TaxID=1872578 RepID=UPI0025C6CE03|nr:hypothetical protein [Aquabacterium sp.]
MPEPTASAAVTLAASAVAVPALTVAGMSLGLRADILLAGWAGSVAAMSLINTVPGAVDSKAALLRTSVRRVGVSVGSAMTAGYTAPLCLLINGFPESVALGVAFVIGAGAMKILPWLIERIGAGQGAKP